MIVLALLNTLLLTFLKQCTKSFFFIYSVLNKCVLDNIPIQPLKVFTSPTSLQALYLMPPSFSRKPAARPTCYVSLPKLSLVSELFTKLYHWASKAHGDAISILLKKK